MMHNNKYENHIRSVTTEISDKVRLNNFLGFILSQMGCKSGIGRPSIDLFCPGS